VHTQGKVKEGNTLRQDVERLARSGGEGVRLGEWIVDLSNLVHLLGFFFLLHLTLQHATIDLRIELIHGRLLVHGQRVHRLHRLVRLFVAHHNHHISIRISSVRFEPTAV
jgi:hypothetical protein